MFRQKKNNQHGISIAMKPRSCTVNTILTNTLREKSNEERFYGHCLYMSSLTGCCLGGQQHAGLHRRPPDTLLYYYHITGNTLYVAGEKAGEVDFAEELSLWREVYYFNVGSLLANAQVIVPFGHASLEVAGADQSSSGIGDIILLGTVWFVNRPATKTYLAFSPYFSCPRESMTATKV